MKKILFSVFLMLLFLSVDSAISQTTRTVGTGGNYATLGAAFDAINSGTLTGSITLQIISSFTDNRTDSLIASGSGSANYTSVLIYPTGSGYTITGTVSGPLIALNGADNVTIDGRVNQTGNTNMTVVNTITFNTAATTIRFMNDATSNTIKHCTIKGSSASVSSGIILFSTTTGTTGNDNNTISNCNIASNGTSYAYNCIFATGTSGADNNGNIISGNNLYDYFRTTGGSYGIYIGSYNTGWTIDGNSFYQTTTKTGSGTTQYGISIISSSGNNFVVTNNYIGGDGPNAAVTNNKWTLAGAYNNSFTGIYISVGTASESILEGNVIKNISVQNALSVDFFYGINSPGGLVKIGNTSGNTIGNTGISATTQTAASIVLLKSTSNGGAGYGIINSGNSAVKNILNNKIGGIYIASASGPDDIGASFYGISCPSGSGTNIISGNTIGSTTNANSIYSEGSKNATTNPNTLGGIYVGAAGINTISDNTVKNISYAAAGGTGGPSTAVNVFGISIASGNNTISSNTVSDLSNVSNNPGSDESSSVIGIKLTYTGATAHTISGNKIYNLSNTSANYSGNIIGIYYFGGTTASSVLKNFIYGLSVSSPASSAALYGIKIAAGKTTYSNNIISIGGNTVSTLYGIYETGAPSNDNSLYFNTVHIYGSPTSGTLNSYALYSAAITNIRNFRNNIFVNARSNSGATGSHYAMYITTTGGTLTCDYNDYYITGSGGVLGYYGANKTSLPIVTGATGNDAHSLNINPEFANPSGTAAADFKTSARTIVAATGTGITTDYNGAARDNNYPTMGALESDTPLPVSLSSFTYSVNSRKVVLYWQTTSEINNSGFYVERTRNDESAGIWKNIGFIQGSGTTSEPKTYSFTDSKLETGTYLYRLKQTDFNGNFEYYTLSREIEIGIPEKFELGQNYPNPFNPATKIDFALPSDTKISLIIFDITGKEVKTLINNEYRKANYYTETFSAAGLSSGVYFYRIVADKFVMTKKMVLIK